MHSHAETRATFTFQKASNVVLHQRSFHSSTRATETLHLLRRTTDERLRVEKFVQLRTDGIEERGPLDALYEVVVLSLLLDDCCGLV